MKKTPIHALALALALGGMVLAPVSALAGPGGKGKDKGNQGKSPKKNGYHDNRDQWWKDGDRRNVRSYRDDDDDDDDDRRDRRDRRERRNRAEDQFRNGVNRQGRTVDEEYARRQRMKNEWRNIGYVAGGVALLGLLKNDSRLVFAGAAGALYSAYRYEQDRKSQNELNRLRAEFFSRPYFYRDGRRYDRRTVVKNGERYYQFVRR